MFNESVKCKFRKTMVEKYDVEWAQQNNIIKNKSKITWDNNDNKFNIIKNRTNKIKNKSKLEKEEIEKKKKETISNNFGDYDSFIEYRNNKIKEKSIIKYGVSHHLSSKEIISKRIETYKNTITNNIINKIGDNYIYIDRNSNINDTDFIIKIFCKTCKSNFDINRQYLDYRCSSNEEICLLCNPKLSGTSYMENEVFEFVNKYKNAIHNYKINNIEIDIYIPDLKIGFEFNGLFWHSEIYKSSNFHINKTKKLKEQGITLIHIWEDDWLYKKDIVKSIILNKIGLTKTKIYARKCEVKNITNNNIIKEFLEKNHIQGFVGSKYKIGLFHNNELISIMTFSLLRKPLNQKNIKNTYELIRFCNKINTSVIGGASKLLNFFIKNYNPTQIISYSDYSRSDGNLYKKIGFNLSHLSIPNYYWVISGIRKHRFNFRKDKLVKMGFDRSKTEIEIMHENGYYRIHDCGSQKWILNIN